MNIENNWDWKTHQPLIHLMMGSFEPKLVVELGMGFNSTPVFLSYNPERYIGVENDFAWIDYMTSKYSFKSEYKVIHHDLKDPSIVCYTQKVNLPERLQDTLYYKSLADQFIKEAGKPRLLFVDQFTCLRSISIKTLYKDFDIIIYHDCQQEGIDMYDYHFQDIIDSGFEFYILKSPISWTGCLIRPELGYTQTELKGNIHRYIHIFELTNKVEGLYLEKQ